MRRLTLILTSLALVMIAGCSDSGFKKTRSGLLYKIISNGKGPAAKRGEFIKVEFQQKLRDSVLGSSYGQLPAYVMVDSVGPIYDPAEVFNQLRKGDSAIIIMMGDTLYKKNGGLPDFFKRKDKLMLTIKVLDVFPDEGASMKDKQAAMEQFQKRQEDEANRRKPEEIKAIQDYLAKKNITAQQTKNGVFYEIISKGPGPKADSGKIVSVHYTGYTLDGRYFDSNVDESKQAQKHPLQPFEFTAGVNGAIPGMLEAITEFGKGDKGRMFIPAVLAYRENSRGGPIKPWENLVFDIEVLDVRDNTPQPAPGQIPPQAPNR